MIILCESEKRRQDNKCPENKPHNKVPPYSHIRIKRNCNDNIAVRLRAHRLSGADEPGGFLYTSVGCMISAASRRLVAQFFGKPPSANGRGRQKPISERLAVQMVRNSRMPLKNGSILFDYRRRRKWPARAALEHPVGARASRSMPNRWRSILLEAARRVGAGWNLPERNGRSVCLWRL